MADFVANVFLEVMRSAGGYDPRRGNAVAWLYGLAGNVAAGMRRQQQRLTDAEHRLAGRALLDADDYARVEERIDAASALRRAFEAMQQLRAARPPPPRSSCGLIGPTRRSRWERRPISGPASAPGSRGWAASPARW